jgi:Secretion system C-terminal sorting domain
VYAIFHYFYGVKNGVLLLLVNFLSLGSFAQFAGPADTPGSTAMHRDSSAFVNWANSCELQLGLIDISNPFSGFANNGNDLSPLGFPDGMCVSLGDSGVATVSFIQAISNESGPDFAVFENAFNDLFLELGFVEVSSDGIQFIRFPATSDTQTQTQIGPFMAVGDATLLNNLAGKYRANYGTPFDLEELSGTPGLDLSAITHVRVVDAVGKISGNHVQIDSNGRPINDPHPTAFPSGGFDLDAIGVIHQQPLGIENSTSSQFLVYPNPVHAHGQLSVQSNATIDRLTLYGMNGILITSSESNSIYLDKCSPGIYLLTIESDQVLSTQKITVQ